MKPFKARGMDPAFGFRIREFKDPDPTDPMTSLPAALYFVWSVKEHPNGEKEDEKFKLLKCYLEMHNSSGALGAIVLCTLVPAYISPPPQ